MPRNLCQHKIVVFKVETLSLNSGPQVPLIQINSLLILTLMPQSSALRRHNRNSIWIILSHTIISMIKMQIKCMGN